MRNAAFASLLFLAACGTAQSSPGLNPPPPAPEPLAEDSGFVTAHGTQFELGGQPFTFQGSNFYRLGLLDHMRSEKQVYDIMDQYKKAGIKVVRIWGFNCGSPDALVTGVKDGQVSYSQPALKRMDVAIDAAKRTGIKLIIPLVNYRDAYCPMSWWVKAVKGGGPTEAFYTDFQVQRAFKTFVSMFLDHTNAVSRDHKAYKDEPAIMAIELANEPGTSDDYDKNKGLAPGETLYQWVADMSAHIRSIDHNHMISTGEEGYKAECSDDGEAQSHGWLCNGMKGSNWEKNLTLPNVSFATVHTYPAEWQIPSSEVSYVTSYLVQDRADIAHRVGKPIIMEETGVSTQSNQQYGWASDQVGFFRTLYGAAVQAGYAGTMAWELVPPGSEQGDYIFDFNSPQGKEILKDLH